MNFFQKTFAIAAIGAAAVGSPSLAEDEDKGFYATGSIGYSQIQDIDVEDSSSDLTFDSGIGFDLGVGYDFGKLRVEATWDRATSGEIEWLTTSDADTTVDSYLASLYFDIETESKWTPFLGASIGSATAEIDDADDSSFTYGIQAGVSYEASEKVDIFAKVSYLIIDELEIGSWEIDNGSVFGARVGARFKF